jgi:hypothetical protein
MGRGRQVATASQALASRPSSPALTPVRAEPRDWQELAERDLEAFAIEVATAYETELAAALKAATKPDRSGRRWWQGFARTELARPEVASWGLILLYLAHWEEFGPNRSRHTGAGVYEVSREELVEFAQALEAGQTAGLSERSCFPSFSPLRPL